MTTSLTVSREAHRDNDSRATSARWPSLEAFVADYLCRVYARQVTDTTEAVWCPCWWEHPEAVERLTVLWRTREEKGSTATGLSGWWLDHCDPHMTRLLDPAGPFKYCSARHGHKGLLQPLPISLFEVMPA